MKRPKRSRSQKTLRNRLAGSDSSVVRLWWDEKKNNLVWLTDRRVTNLRGIDHLRDLAEHVPFVLVSYSLDQIPARLAALNTLGRQRVKIVVANRWTGSKANQHPWSKLRKAESEPEKIYARDAIEGYDEPLAALQLSVKFPQLKLDPVEFLKGTWVGEFHQAWDIPLTSQAAEYWARVGDIFSWLGRTDNSPPDLSSAVPVEVIGQEMPRMEDSTLECHAGLFAIFFGARPKRNTVGPRTDWPMASLSKDLTERKSLRRLLPMAWSGTQDVEAVLNQMVADTQKPLADPRRWLWRGLLRASVGEVNRAYVDAVVGWILSRIIHPELFPPIHPLFDEAARAYWLAQQSQSRQQRQSA